MLEYMLKMHDLGDLHSGGDMSRERCMLGKDVFSKESHAGGRSYCGKTQSCRGRCRLGEMLAVKKCILGMLLVEIYILRRTHDVSDECWGYYI